MKPGGLKGMKLLKISLIVTCLLGCTPTETKPAKPEEPRPDFIVLVDKETGCEYLRPRFSVSQTSVIQRFNAEGKQICRFHP